MTDTTRRLGAKRIAEDIQSLRGLNTVENYRPVRREASLANLKRCYDAMERSRQQETMMEARLKASRDRAREMEWAFHQAVLAMRESILGQFGPDSDEIQAVGYKKKTARRPTRRRVPMP